MFFEVLVSVHPPDVARAWFMGMNLELGDASPAEALSDGRSREVMAAARSFIAADWAVRRAWARIGDLGLVDGPTWFHQ